MPRYLRTEIWSDLQCAGGARLAVVPDVVSLSCTRRVTGDDGLSLSLPVNSIAWPHIFSRRVVRVVFADGSFDEWRILRAGKRRQGGVQPGMVECVAVLADLARAVLERVEADGAAVVDFEAVELTPLQHLHAFITPALIAHGLTWVSIGTIEPADPIDVVYSRTSALEAIRQIAQVSNAEFQIRRNGTSGYYIDVLTKIGSSAPSRTARLGKNITGVEWTENADEQTTRIYGTGTAIDSIHSTIALAEWIITAKSGNALILADPLGGPGPIAFDDQLNGLYIRKSNGTTTQITDTVVTTQQVIVSNAAGFSVHDYVRVCRNSNGAELTFLRSLGAESTYGIYPGFLDRPDLPSTVNLVRNPALRAWNSGLPVNWNKLGDATITQTTAFDRWQHGGRSARIQTSVDGDGIETDLCDILPTASRPYFSGSIGFYLVTGRIRLELVATDGSQEWILPDGTNGKAYSTQIDVWNELVVAGLDLNELSAIGCKLRIVQEGVGTADFYLDTAQINQFHEQEPFIEGSGPNKLWHAINDRLRTHADPQTQIRINLVDLEQINPAVFAHESLALGGTIRAKDTTLGVDVTTRIVEIAKDLITNKETTLVLSNRPEDLTDILVRSRHAGRQIRYGNTERTLTVQATFDTPSSSPATVQVRLAARPKDAKIFYIVQSVDDPVPIIGAVAWQQYTQSIAVDQLTASDLIVAAYAQIGASTSAVETWRIAKAIRPQVALSLSEPDGGTLAISWTQSGDVIKVAVYRKTGGWPTTNGSDDGPLDLAQFIGEWAVDPDGGGRRAGGIPDVGRTSVTECSSGCDMTHTYNALDQVFVIAVPIDTSGRPGPRAAASLEIQGAPAPALSAFGRALNSAGADCDHPAKVELTWTPNGEVTDGSHHVKIYRSVDSAPRELITTISAPVSVTSYVDTLHQYVDPSKPTAQHVYSYELGSSLVVLASGSASPINLNLSTECMGPAGLALVVDRVKRSVGVETWWRISADAPYTNAPAGAALRFFRSYDGVAWTPLTGWTALTAGNGSRSTQANEFLDNLTYHVRVDMRDAPSDAARLLATKTSSVYLPPL